VDLSSVQTLDTSKPLPVILKSQVLILIGPLPSNHIGGLYLFALLLNIITSLDCGPAEIGKQLISHRNVDRSISISLFGPELLLLSLRLAAIAPASRGTLKFPLVC
jgi:hypothetical protein